MGAIVAPSHVGKTALAIRVVEQALKAGHVVGYVMEESTAHDFRARLGAAGIKDELLSRLLVFFQLGVRLDDEVWRSHLEGELIRNKVVLCLYDTWSDVTSLDQLDQAKVLPVLKDVREMRKRAACSHF